MKLMIVDDHVIFREGLASIIRSEPDIEIVALAGSVQEAVQQAREKCPEVILMDYGLPDGRGTDAACTILSEQPETIIVFLTIYENDENLLDAVRSGARGYLLKNMHPAKLVAALRSVYNGESALSRAMTLRVMQELANSPETRRPGDQALTSLTEREIEILRELVAGCSNNEIAQHLFISENTVKHHLHAIFEKLQVPNRHAAVEYARLHGIHAEK